MPRSIHSFSLAVCIIAIAATELIWLRVAYAQSTWRSLDFVIFFLIFAAWQASPYLFAIGFSVGLQDYKVGSYAFAIGLLLLASVGLYFLYLSERPLFRPHPGGHLRNCVGPVAEIGIPLFLVAAVSAWAAVAWMVDVVWSFFRKPKS